MYSFIVIHNAFNLYQIHCIRPHLQNTPGSEWNEWASVSTISMRFDSWACTCADVCVLVSCCLFNWNLHHPRFLLNIPPCRTWNRLAWRWNVNWIKGKCIPASFNETLKNATTRYFRNAKDKSRFTQITSAKIFSAQLFFNHHQTIERYVNLMPDGNDRFQIGCNTHTQNGKTKILFYFAYKSISIFAMCNNLNSTM